MDKGTLKQRLQQISVEISRRKATIQGGILCDGKIPASQQQLRSILENAPPPPTPPLLLHVSTQRQCQRNWKRNSSHKSRIVLAFLLLFLLTQCWLWFNGSGGAVYGWVPTTTTSKTRRWTTRTGGSLTRCREKNDFGSQAEQDSFEHQSVPLQIAYPRPRRHFVTSLTNCVLFEALVIGGSGPPRLAFADEGITEAKAEFTRETDLFRYAFKPPNGFAGPSQKPLKTHLDEVNFVSNSVPGYQFGITVDPVRIDSLSEFGTAEQAAAKVVLAEVNRDGIFNVKLVEDPFSSTLKSTSASTAAVATPPLLFYQLNYTSSGKRGDKRFIAKFFVENQKLFALTAQCKEEDFAAVQHGMKKAVDSFRVLL